MVDNYKEKYSSEISDIKRKLNSQWYFSTRNSVEDLGKIIAEDSGIPEEKRDEILKEINKIYAMMANFKISHKEKMEKVRGLETMLKNA